MRRTERVSGPGASVHGGVLRFSGAAQRGLSIAVDGAFAGLLLAAAVRAFERRLPENGPIDLSWAGHGSDPEMLLGRGGDLALVGVAPSAPGISSVVLSGTERRVLVGASHALAAEGSVAPAALTREPELHAQNAGSGWNETWSVAGVAGHATSSGHSFNRFEDALDLVAAGRGILIAPDTAEARHNRPDVCWLALDGVGPAAVHLAWRTASLSPALVAFIAIAGSLGALQGPEDGGVDERTPGRRFRGYGIIVP